VQVTYTHRHQQQSHEHTHDTDLVCVSCVVCPCDSCGVVYGALVCLSSYQCPSLHRESPHKHFTRSLAHSLTHSLTHSHHVDDGGGGGGGGESRVISHGLLHANHGLELTKEAHLSSGSTARRLTKSKKLAESGGEVLEEDLLILGVDGDVFSE